MAKGSKSTTTGQAEAASAASAETPAAAAPAEANSPAIDVRARQAQGRRRAGLAFGPGWTRFEAGALTPEAFEAIAADPQLEVRAVQADGDTTTAGRA